MRCPLQIEIGSSDKEVAKKMHFEIGLLRVESMRSRSADR